MKLPQIVKRYAAFLIIILIVLAFFNKTIIFGQIPFPGDLLVGQYAPYASYPFMGYNPGSYPNKAQDFDVITLVFPDKNFSIETIRKGEFPLWNPYVLSGNPHLATFHSATFYPFNLLFFIMPIIYAWSLYIILQPILAGFFTYLFLRELKLGTKSSFFGGLIFAFSSYFVVWMEYGNLGHSILWLPLILYLILKLTATRKPIFYLLVIISLTFSILAGYIQLAFYVFVFSFIFLLFILFIHSNNPTNTRVWQGPALPAHTQSRRYRRLASPKHPPNKPVESSGGKDIRYSSGLGCSEPGTFLTLEEAFNSGVGLERGNYI